MSCLLLFNWPCSHSIEFSRYNVSGPSCIQVQTRPKSLEFGSHSDELKYTMYYLIFIHDLGAYRFCLHHQCLPPTWEDIQTVCTTMFV